MLILSNGFLNTSFFFTGTLYHRGNDRSLVIYFCPGLVYVACLVMAQYMFDGATVTDIKLTASLVILAHTAIQFVS